MQIQPVTSAKLRQLFIQLPKLLHGSESNWAPSLMHDEKRLLGFIKGHPFPSENSVQCWLAFRGDTPVGRIAAVQHAQAESYSPRVAQFGFLAVRNEPLAAKALFDAAAQWAWQKGMDVLEGPFSPSINYSVGLLQSGFDREPSFQIPCNPNYYPNLMEQAGLKPLQDLFALEIEGDTMLQSTKRLERVAERLTKRYGVKFRPMNPWHRRSELELFLSIAQQSLQSHWGFVPLSPREKMQLVADMSWVVQPRLLQFAQIDGKVVGASLALADFAPAIKRIGGKLLPFGFLQLWRARRRAIRYRLVAANILPDFQRIGLAPALVGRIMRNVSRFGAKRIEFSWIAESNPLSFSTIESGGAIRSKTMRIYHAKCVDLMESKPTVPSVCSTTTDTALAHCCFPNVMPSEL